MIPEEQHETVALLQGLAGRPPIETHISAVFVGENTVWKLRKAVHLPFVDFTRLEERHRTANRELELNAPHAEGMYRDVLPVTRGAEGLRLGGEGTALDWVLRMARVPAKDFLDEIAKTGPLSPRLLDELADTVADMHATLAPVVRRQADNLRRIADGNVASARAAMLDRAAVDRWHTDMVTAIDHTAGWLEARAADGFVRRAHGDLHLGNLCLWRGHLVPFDALEFDEDLATIDLGYDLAFLLMDLEQRCGRPAANRVLNRYVARTGDAGMVRGLPIFLSMRAMVRAHVAASSGGDGSDYLARAQDMLHPPSGRALAVGGLPGTGKSTFARAIAPWLGPAPGALILRSDEIRKRRFGVAPEQHLPPAAYAEPASRAVMDELFQAFGEVAAAGHSVIADATFMDPADRAGVTHAAGQVPFQGLWLEADIETLAARIRGRHGDASDADEAFLRKAAQADCGRITWIHLDAGADPSVPVAAFKALPPA